MTPQEQAAPDTAEAITDEHLAELHALANAASDGPWFTSDPNEGSGHGPLWHVHNDAYINPHLTEDEAESGFGAIIELGSRDDAEFIAAARKAVPVLLAEVERLRGELAAFEPAIRSGITLYQHSCGYAEELIAADIAEMDANGGGCDVCEAGDVDGSGWAPLYRKKVSR